MNDVICYAPIDLNQPYTKYSVGAHTICKGAEKECNKIADITTSILFTFLFND